MSQLIYELIPKKMRQIYNESKYYIISGRTNRNLSNDNTPPTTKTNDFEVRK